MALHQIAAPKTIVVEGGIGHDRDPGGIGVLIALVVSLAIRVAWPLADPSSRLSWSNGVYTDPATMVHAARNAP